MIYGIFHISISIIPEEEKMIARKEGKNMRRFAGILIFLLALASCAPKSTEVQPTPPIVLPPTPKLAKIAVVLGAGASKGFAHVAKQFGADIVIAVAISAGAERTFPENTIETILRSFDIMYSKLASIQVCNADVVIKPKVGHLGSADFSKRHEAILEGERAAIEMLPQIQQIVNQLRLEGRLE